MMNHAALQKIRDGLASLNFFTKMTYGEMIEVLDALLDDDAELSEPLGPTPPQPTTFYQTPEPRVDNPVPLTKDFPDIVRPKP